jgi:DNA (cytosine-5)-methyltransferase 1
VESLYLCWELKTYSLIHIGLFEGIGGFTLAAKWAGWTSPLACEIDTFCQKVLTKNFPEMILHGDIHTLTYESINSQLSGKYGADWRTDDIIITGGFPCQPFSTAGKRNGKSDDRYLWPEMLRVIREVRPTWVVGENVAGLLSMDGGSVFEEVCASLEAEGYEVQSFVIPAIAVGAPHRRDRVWIVAHSESAHDRGNAGALSGANGRQERHNISQFGGTDFARVAQNSERDGRKYDGDQKASEVREFGNAGAGNGIGVYKESDTADATSPRLSQPRQTGERELSKKGGARLHNRFEQPGSNSRHADQPRLEGCGQHGECAGEWAFGPTAWDDHWYEAALATCNVRMDDGLSGELEFIGNRDNRTARLKALGNAIVPNVAYEIFRAINEVNEQLCATQSPQ